MRFMCYTCFVMNTTQFMERVNAIKAKIKASEAKIDNSITKIQATNEEFDSWKDTLTQKTKNTEQNTK